MKFKSSKSEAIKQISRIKPYQGAKTGIGRMIQNANNRKLNKMKINAIKELGQGDLARTIKSASGLAQAIVAQETAKDLARAKSNSYQAGLAAWTKNFNGNPTPDDGADGTTQKGSTSELGG